jgi:hypothetical protein
VSGLTDYSATNLLNYLTAVAGTPATPTPYVALFTVAPASDANPATGQTEVTGGSYARISSAGKWNTASNSSGSEPSTTPAFTSNSTTISFVTATADWGTVVAFGIYDSLAATTNLLAWDYLGNFSWLPATTSAASPMVVTSKAHGYSNGDIVVVTIKFGGTLSTLSQGSFTGLLTVGAVTTDTFTLATSGAVALNASTTGDMNVRKITSQSVPNGVQASFAGGTPGALVITSA